MKNIASIKIKTELPMVIKIRALLIPIILVALYFLHFLSWGTLGLVAAVTIGVTLLHFIGYKLQNKIFAQVVEIIGFTTEIGLASYILYLSPLSLNSVFFVYTVLIVTPAILNSLRKGLYVATLAALFYGIIIVWRHQLSYPMLFSNIIFFYALAILVGSLSDKIKNYNESLKNMLDFNTRLYAKLKGSSDIIFDFIDDAVVIFDPKGKVIKANPPAHEILGQEIEGKSIDTLAKMFDSNMDTLPLDLPKGQGRIFEIIFKKPKPEVLQAKVSSMWLQKQLLGTIVVLQNSEDLKQLNKK